VRALFDEARAVRATLSGLLEAFSGGRGERVNFNGALRSVLERAGSRLETRRVSVLSFLEPALPDVPADPLAVMRALEILLALALESLRSSGGTFTARTWIEDAWVCLALSDDRSGGHASGSVAELEPLFEGPSPEVEQGLGEVAAILRRLGGRFLVERRAGVWNRHTLMLPAQRRPRPEPPSPPQSDSGSPPRLQVLVVDDNAALRSVLRRYLERRGHSVTEASDGEQALRLVRQRTFDRLMLDIRMPGASGPELFLSLREVAPDLCERTTFMAAGTLEDGLERFVTDTGRPAIKKPFDMTELLRTVGS
jgi:CheY-like chemotaxis protein